MNINELRIELDKLGYEVMNYHNEESFTLRKHGHIESEETIYNLERLEERYFDLLEILDI